MKYIIPGDPIPLARARIGYGYRKMYDSQRQAKTHSAIYLQSQQGPEPPLSGPLHLDVTFFLKMPKLSPRKRKERNYIYHYYRPDLSNLIKFVEDVANKLLFLDDAQICCITSRKVYHEEPRTEFEILKIDTKEKFST